MDFKGKNILIVGASTGIGHQIAETILAKGAKVYVAGRNAPDLEVLFSEWDALHPQASAFDELPELLHGLVYCPGTIQLKPFHRLSSNDFTNDWQINAMGAVSAIQPNISRLKKAQGASIVLFSTVAVNQGFSFHTSISMAKGALQGLAVSLAAEYAAAGIRVNVVAPSLTDTPLAANLLANEEKRDSAAKRHPLNRIGTANDMANAAEFLLSDASGWITGQVLGIDGGLSKVR